MAIRSIIVASACAAGAAMAFTWGLSSIGPEPSVEVQEVPDRAWRVDIEELPSEGSDIHEPESK